MRRNVKHLHLLCTVLLACAILAIAFPAGAWAAPAPYDVAAADKDWKKRANPGVADEMIASLEEATKASPSNGELLWRLSRAYWWKAARYTTDRVEKLAVLDKAKAAGEQGAKLAPGNADAQYWHAVSIAQAGQIRGILQSLFMVKPTKEALDKALAIDPNHASSHYLMAELMHQVPGPPISIGNKAKSVEEARLAVKYGPDDSSHRLVLGKCLIATKQYAEARQALEYVVKMSVDPEDPEGTRLDRAEAEELLASIKGK
mgnify:CR=1 FL=1